MPCHPVLVSLMSILVQTVSGIEISREATTASHFEVGSWARPTPPYDVTRSAERARVRGLLFERRYKQIVEARLGHIPARLPFTKSAIIQRLQENDRSSPNWPAQERMLDIDAQLALVHRSISGHEDRPREKKDPKERRLNWIWDLLSLSAERFGYLRSQRIGRFNFNVGLFSRSDLPSTYLVGIGESTHWEIAALAIATDAEARRLVESLCKQPPDQVAKEVFLQTTASLRDIESAYRDYTRRTKRITTISDRVLEWRDALEYYVDLFSAEDLENFRRPRQISLATLDPDIVSHLSVGLHAAVLELRQALASQHPSELADFRWLPADESYLTGLVQLELEAA